MWRDRLNVSVSKMEDLVREELASRRIPFESQSQVVVTTADFRVRSARDILVFIDGEPHTHNGQALKDDKIRSALRAVGYTVLEFPYQNPSLSRMKEIVEEIVSEYQRQETKRF